MGLLIALFTPWILNSEQCSISIFPSNASGFMFEAVIGDVEIRVVHITLNSVCVCVRGTLEIILDEGKKEISSSFPQATPSFTVQASHKKSCCPGCGVGTHRGGEH